MGMTTFWLIAIIVFGVVEGLTVGLTSVWFALGALVAFLAAALGASLVVQIILFLLVSFLCLMLIRPLGQRFLNKTVVATNADRIIGQEAIVTEAIDNLKGQGHVSVAGVPWTARSGDESRIPVDTKVRILRIEGVKVFVSPAAIPESEVHTD